MIGSQLSVAGQLDTLTAHPLVMYAGRDFWYLPTRHSIPDALFRAVWDKSGDVLRRVYPSPPTPNREFIPRRTPSLTTTHCENGG